MEELDSKNEEKGLQLFRFLWNRNQPILGDGAIKKIDFSAGLNKLSLSRKELILEKKRWSPFKLIAKVKWEGILSKVSTIRYLDFFDINIDQENFISDKEDSQKHSYDNVITLLRSERKKKEILENQSTRF